jgi:beta-glucosidase
MPRRCLLCLLALWPGRAQAQAPMDPQTQAVEKLLAEMNLAEKVGQLSQYSFGSATGPGGQEESITGMIAAGQVGSLLNVTSATQVEA